MIEADMTNSHGGGHLCAKMYFVAHFHALAILHYAFKALIRIFIIRIKCLESL